MNAKKVHLIYILLMLSGLLAGACRDEEPQPVYPGRPGDTLTRTLVVYMAGENSLYNYLQTDSLEIAWGLDSIPEDTRVVLFMDDAKSTRLCVGARGTPLQVVRKYESNLCSTDSLTMAMVLQEIFRLYPARSYGLVFCSHASGWLFENTAPSQAPRRSFGIDNGRRSTSDSGVRMNIPTLAGVLSGCPHLDFLFFDACFMQCVEVAYELRHIADYIIASPAEIPGTGAPYTAMLRQLCTSPTDAAQIARDYRDYYTKGRGASEYGGVEISAVRTDRLESLAAATAPLMRRLLSGGAEIPTDGVQRFYPDLSSRRYTAYFDLKNLFFNRLDDADYARWVRVFDETVIAQELSPHWYSNYNSGTRLYVADPEHSGALSIYVPRHEHDAKGWVKDYHRLQWYQDIEMQTTNW